MLIISSFCFWYILEILESLNPGYSSIFWVPAISMKSENLQWYFILNLKGAIPFTMVRSVYAVLDLNILVISFIPIQPFLNSILIGGIYIPLLFSLFCLFSCGFKHIGSFSSIVIILNWSSCRRQTQSMLRLEFWLKFPSLLLSFFWSIFYLVVGFLNQFLLRRSEFLLFEFYSWVND